MSQRNPMNDRYTTERQGQTRKSAASAKPKSQRAATLRDPTPKTRKQKKQERKEREAKARERISAIDARYEDTEEYRRYRRIWWGCLIAAICCTAVSFALSTFVDTFSFLPPEVISGISMVTMIGAYGFIIFAFYIDFSRIRKGRSEFQARALYDNSKEARAAQKQARAKARDVEDASKKQAEDEAAPTPEKPKGLFGFMKRDKKDADEANDDATSDPADANDSKDSKNDK